MDQDIQSKVNVIDHTYTAWSVVDYLQNLSKETEVSFGKLFVIFGHKCLSDGDKLRFLLYIDSLNLPDKYDVLVESCTDSYIQVFREMENALGDGEFFDYVKDKIEDDAPFCQALRKIYSPNNDNISYFEAQCNLWKLLFSNLEKIPKTLEHILQVAIAVKDYYLIIYLGEFFSKKRILGILTAHGDTVLIDKFFFLYKGCSEIKNLTPFI